MKFEFIEAEKSTLPVKELCRVLGVSRSGFYASRRRAESKHARDDRRLRVLCREEHERSYKRSYGSPRVYDRLRLRNIAISKKRVARLLREEGIRVRPRRKWATTTNSSHSLPVAPNLLNREFTATAPNQRWAGDVTYLRTPHGFVYLAVIIDLFSRFVVGWAISAVNDRHLALAALDIARRRRSPARGLLHHTDRGSPYASEDYQTVLDISGFVCSMSRRGNCYDNAVVESFFKTLKQELGEDFDSAADAKRQAFEYIEIWFNRNRMHSSLGQMSPAAYEEAARMRLAA